MASVGDVTVKLRVKDEVTPALRRITRQIWIMEHADAVYLTLMVVWFIVGSLLGFVIGRFV